jgi:hypothetical protein
MPKTPEPTQPHGVTLAGQGAPLPADAPRPGTPTHYRAYVQMAVELHNKTLEIVEAEIVLPLFYRPRPGDYLYHRLVNGLMPVGLVFFDGTRDTVVLTLVGCAYDYTAKLDEWLKERPEWYKPAVPFIVEKKSNAAAGGFEDDDD